MRRELVGVIFLLLFLACAPRDWKAGRSVGWWLQYDTVSYSFEGVVKLEKYYGPPNYGENPETDLEEWTYMLVLPTPISVSGQSVEDEPHENVKKIQLVFDWSRFPIKSYVGRRVCVTGTLFAAITGHHHAPVLLKVERITAGMCPPGPTTVR